MPPTSRRRRPTGSPGVFCRTGSTSAELAASGASAARDDNDAQPTPEFGPKGLTSRNGAIVEQETNAQPPVPPVPPGLAAEPVPGTNDDNVYFSYAVGRQNAVTTGVGASLVIGKPLVAREDWHSLAEIALQSADGLQTVEVGWTVDRSVNGDDQSHLFVFNWVDGAPRCYNACDFVPAKGASITPGAVLPKGALKNFGIQHIGDGWWIGYESEWIGMFPDARWNVDFKQSGLVQFFGEVAASPPVPASTTDNPTTPKGCTQMGTGAKPDTSAATRFSTIVYVDGPPISLTVKNIGKNVVDYATNKLTSQTFRFGGPGPDPCLSYQLPTPTPTPNGT